ncbi:MAG: FHA domain-containing protein, partial [Anaerolineales bacterium]|nr:FHA domain-containing protein [Anaerolineales bacterium]MDW8447501.1 FHA domain-containing protein [Anaerolineales bacterium]
MSSVPFQLVMRAGPQPGAVFPLQKNEIYIGRDPSNDLVISDIEVSRKHARLIRQAGGYILEDLGSTNGTFVNGQRLLGPHLMRPGEVIQLGESVSLVFEALYDLGATRVSPASAGYPPAAPSYLSQAAPPPPAAPVYSTPAYPLREQAPQELEPEKSKLPLWIFAGCGCLTVILCVL